MKALLIIDVQNDFLPGGRLPVTEGDAVIPVINEILPLYPVIAATQDWHPPGHSSFASSHTGCEPFEKIDLNGVEQTLWPDHCVWGSDGAEFPRSLQLDRASAVFRKGMDPRVDSYSGFFDNCRRHKTGLAEWLRTQNVDTVHLVGLAGDVCVAYTARDAVELGFEVAILEDGTRPISQKTFDDLAIDLRHSGVKFLNSRALVE